MDYLIDGIRQWDFIVVEIVASDSYAGRV